ncbi:MAG TPA: acetate--CoA ligase family protein [Methylomirabilota bacterium]|nr:acetate--CoA ligase family protein [Methylomirabilota bacterium]
MTPLTALFAPRRLALLGVSRDPRKLGHVLLRNVVAGGFAGEIFVVNPGGEPILGLPTVPRVSDLPSGIDLALISLPPHAVLEAVTALARCRSRVAVILTSGFGEVDARGREDQAALLAAARAGGLRLVGPNCMGVYSRAARLNGTYFWDLPQAPGHVGVISQSGAYGGLIMRHLGGQGIGVSRFLSIGNQADLDIADALDYLAADTDTRLVACFIEAVRDGRRFVEAAARVTTSKPMVVLKAGRTEAGRRAAGSHTGSLAGSAEVYQAAFARAGVLACAETEEFFDCLQALATTPTRPTRPSLAVITVSGGPSVVAADAAEAAGLAVTALGPEIQEKLRKLLPGFAAVGNPVDMTPQVNPEHIADAAALVLSQAAVGGALAVNVGLDIVAFADGLLTAARSAGKPVVACAVDSPAVAERFRAGGVPVYPTPERAVRAYRGLWVAAQRPLTAPRPQMRPLLRVELQSILDSAHGPLPYDLARELLDAYGVRFCRESLAASVEEALEAARAIGFPVVVKTARTDLIHKSEAGGVIVGLRSPADLTEACRSVAARTGSASVFVQAQAADGFELLVGGRRDESFGPVVAVGTGGVLAELVRDVTLALAPLSVETALTLVPLGLRGRAMAGHRSLPPWEAEPAARALVAVGSVLVNHPRIREIDVNPLIARGDEAVAVDALVILD